MTKKNKIKGVLIGGLLLSAPFAVIATSNADSTTISNDLGYGKERSMHRGQGSGGYMKGTLLDDVEISENQILRLDAAIERKIENANYLIEQLAEKDSEVDTVRLYEIVEEFAKLDSELDALDVEDALAEDLKEIYLDSKEEATELTTEFREIISNVFSEDEKVELREELREQHQEDRQNNMIEHVRIIDEDIAEQLDNEEITFNEARELIKEKFDSMSEEELAELKDELKGSMPESGKGFGPGMHKGGMRRGIPE